MVMAILAGLTFFSLGYVTVRTLLQTFPVILVFPSSGMVYRDDRGVCYTYDRIECESEA